MHKNGNGEKPAGDCAVCTEASSGYHFGVIVCRACAAFFRRTVVVEARYVCRHNNACTIDKSVRSMCRACRFRKCLEVGMKKDSIQYYRDSIKKPEEEPRSKSLDRAQLVVPNRAPDEGRVSNPELDELFRRINATFEYAARYYKPAEGDTLLRRMIAGYERICQKRPLIHNSTKFVFRDTNVSPEENQRRVENNVLVFSTLMKQENDLFADMLVNFDPFVTLPPIQRWVLFKHFWPHFKTIEGAFHSMQALGDSDHMHCMMANGQVVDFFRTASQLFSLPDLKDEELDALMASTAQLRMNGITKPLVELRPSIEEFAAIAGFILWMHPGDPMLAEETLAVMQAARQEIARNLTAYYAEQGREFEAMERIFELMNIVTIAQKAVAMKREDFLIIQLFDKRQDGKGLFGIYC